jgi:hypothetical protein
MTERAEHTAGPIVGQFAIIRADCVGWHLVSVESVTAKQFKGHQDGTRWKRTVSTSLVEYCGDEATARKLYARLISSRAQFNDENQKARDRLKARDDGLIAAATGANHDS